MNNGNKFQKNKSIIPNTITCLHLFLLIPLFFLLQEKYWFRAGYLFLFTGILDLLDGYLARKLNAVSKLGQVLDTLADKGGMLYRNNIGNSLCNLNDFKPC